MGGVGGRNGAFPNVMAAGDVGLLSSDQHRKGIRRKTPGIELRAVAASIDPSKQLSLHCYSKPRVRPSPKASVLRRCRAARAPIAAHPRLGGGSKLWITRHRG